MFDAHLCARERLNDRLDKERKGEERRTKIKDGKQKRKKRRKRKKKKDRER